MNGWSTGQRCGKLPNMARPSLDAGADDYCRNSSQVMSAANSLPSTIIPFSEVNLSIFQGVLATSTTISPGLQLLRRLRRVSLTQLSLGAVLSGHRLSFYSCVRQTSIWTALCCLDCRTSKQGGPKEAVYMKEYQYVEYIAHYGSYHFGFRIELY